MYKIAIVDDNEKCRQQAREVVTKCCQTQGTACEIEEFENGMSFITRYRPGYDLILLDIEMPLLDGISTARQLREVDSGVFIIFTTFFSQYAMQGYEVSALDFIVKPLQLKTFQLKFQRFVKLHETGQYPYIVIENDGTLTKVKIRDIISIEIIGHYLHYRTDQAVYTRYRTMAEAEEEMEKYHFFRINKSYLVNMARIQKVEYNRVIMDDKTEFDITRNRKKPFMQAFANYLGGM